MLASDLPAVASIARRVHPGYPERDEVFAERLKLYPGGCHVYELNGRVNGYAISHPWSEGNPPALDTLLDALPSGLRTYYIHDIALVPEARGRGAAREIVDLICARACAEGYPDVSLVSVSGTAPFWSARGFYVTNDPQLNGKLASYGEGAAFMVRACGADRKS